MVIRALVVLALAPACTVAEKVAKPDLVCRDELLPADAASKISISGTVTTAAADTVLPDVMIRGHFGSLALMPTTTDPDGAFFYTFDTTKVPRVSYVDATLGGYLDLRYYPSAPVAADLPGLELHMFGPANATAYATAAGITLDPAKGLVIVRVVDCNSSPLIGGTVSTSPRGPDVRYFVDGTPSADATTTDATGMALIANVSAASVTVTGSYEGTSLRSHDIVVAANAVVETSLQP